MSAGSPDSSSTTFTDQHRCLTSALTAMEIAFALYDPEERLLIWSPAYESLFPDESRFLKPGLGLEDVLRLGVDSRKPHDLLDLPLDAFIAQELDRFRHSAGTRIVETIDARSMKNTVQRTDDGGYLSIWRDLTEEQRRIRELERSRGVERAILSNIDVGVVMVNERGKIVSSNECAASLLGLPASFLAGKPYYAHLQRLIFDQDALSAKTEDVVNAEADFEAWREQDDSPEIQDRTLANGNVVEIRTSPLPDGGFVRTYTDVKRDRKLRSKLEWLATTDSLTGVVNRRRFMDVFRTELGLMTRYRKPLSVLLLDLDHFKKVNDTHGHAAGDSVLKAVAGVARASVREVDLVGRLGGEEFGVLFPETGIETAAMVADRLRLAIEARPVPVDAGGLVQVTASIGVALVRPSETDPGPALARADNALYRAKAKGRNKVEVEPAAPGSTIAAEQAIQPAR